MTYDYDGNVFFALFYTSINVAIDDPHHLPFCCAHYEVTGAQVTKYYFAGTTRIAMRKYTIPQPMTVEYFLGDHLGSTSITTDTSGNKVSEMRYKPWGEVRSWWTASLSTTPAYKLPEYSFTGQFSYMDDPSTGSVTEGFGLMFYVSRFYDPALGRFIQADSIIPLQSQGVQAWDRYAFVNNNPLYYTDPTGHDGVPWSRLNPFAYNTLQFSLHITLEALGGATLDIGIAANWKAIKNTITKFDSSQMKDFDAALLVSTSGTAGLEAEASVMASLSATNQSVLELIDDNVSTVLEGEFPVNISICDGVCLGVSPTINTFDPELISEISYSLGGGYGGELGLDVVAVTDWVAYGSESTTNGKIVFNKSLPDIGEMFVETWDTMRRIWRNVNLE